MLKASLSYHQRKIRYYYNTAYPQLTSNHLYSCVKDVFVNVTIKQCIDLYDGGECFNTGSPVQLGDINEVSRVIDGVVYHVSFTSHRRMGDENLYGTGMKIFAAIEHFVTNHKKPIL